MKSRNWTLEYSGFTKAPCEGRAESSDQQCGKGETQGHWPHEKENQVFLSSPCGWGVSQPLCDLCMGCWKATYEADGNKEGKYIEGPPRKGENDWFCFLQSHREDKHRPIWNERLQLQLCSGSTGLISAGNRGKKTSSSSKEWVPEEARPVIAQETCASTSSLPALLQWPSHSSLPSHPSYLIHPLYLHAQQIWGILGKRAFVGLELWSFYAWKWTFMKWKV